jgi:hypothetical protein
MTRFEVRDLDFLETISSQSEELHGGKKAKIYATAAADASADAAAIASTDIKKKGKEYIAVYKAAAAAAGAAASATNINGPSVAKTKVSVEVS